MRRRTAAGTLPRTRLELACSATSTFATTTAVVDAALSADEEVDLVVDGEYGNREKFD